ncbi:DUF6083 domain-containing protein [Streptomyces syringium]|uniref:DUF6083 domain-containing protein n=1 Tax=Streptomyces syringium TaxID=76729 RepID=UPI0037D23E48
MGDSFAPHVCLGCETTGGSVTERGLPFGPLCEACWTGVQNTVDNKQALDEGATAAPPPSPPICRDCGLDQDRYETGYGRWVLLEPRYKPPAHTVPVGHRWIVRADGRAVNAGDSALPRGAVCRIPHRLACPCGDRLPDDTPRALVVLRDHNQAVVDHVFPQGGPPATAAG